MVGQGGRPWQHAMASELVGVERTSNALLSELQDESVALHCSAGLEQHSQLMDSIMQGQAHIPYVSDQIPALTCPNCSQDFLSGDAVIHHLATEGSCGRWLINTLPSMEQTLSVAAGIDYGEDLDTVHDMEGKDFFFHSSLIDLIDVELGWDSIDDQFNDGVDRSATNWEHIEFPDIGNQTDPPQMVGSGRKRIFHHNEGKACPGGLNHLHHMDRNQHARIHNEENVYYPFTCKSEWELANWLSSGSLSQREIDQYLHSQCVSNHFACRQVKRDI